MGQEGIKDTADRGHAAAECHGRFRTFKFADFRLERLHRGVAHAAINKAWTLAQSHVVPDIDIVVTVCGADHDGCLRGIVGMPDLLPAPDNFGPRSGVIKPCAVRFYFH